MLSTMLNRQNLQTNLLERLKTHYGSYAQVAVALGVADNYPSRWRRAGFIPEAYALDIEALRVSDRFGVIDAMDVLRAARDARKAALEMAEQERTA